MQYLGATSKQQNDLGSFPRKTIQHHSKPSLCPNHWCWSSWSWLVLWRPTRPSRTNSKIKMSFSYRGLECKSNKSRNTWNNRQVGIGVQNEVGKRLTEICQKNVPVIANTLFQQSKRWLYTQTSLDGQHQNQIMFFATKDGSALYFQEKQDLELIVAQIMSSLLKNSGLNLSRGNH